MKYLAQNPDRVYTAQVLIEFRSKYRVVIKEFLITTEIKRQEQMPLNLGEEINVRVKKVDPWEDLLDMVYEKK